VDVLQQFACHRRIGAHLGQEPGIGLGERFLFGNLEGSQVGDLALVDEDLPGLIDVLSLNVAGNIVLVVRRIHARTIQ
jgi:hypothetical protein